MPQPIVSADDPALHDYVGLTDVALRRRVEPERGLYIAESEKVIRRALAAGHRPRSFLMAERWLTDLADVVERAEADGIPVYVGDHEVIESLTGFHLHRGALAAMHRPVLPSVGDLVAKASRVLVLEDIVDHTNVGAVFRSAAALGIDAVLVTPRCADPLYRRSIRVSMGIATPQRHSAATTGGKASRARRRRPCLSPHHGRGRPHRDHPDGRGSGLAQCRRRRRRGGVCLAVSVVLVGIEADQASQQTLGLIFRVRAEARMHGSGLEHRRAWGCDPTKALTQGRQPGSGLGLMGTHAEHCGEGRRQGVEIHAGVEGQQPVLVQVRSADQGVRGLRMQHDADVEEFLAIHPGHIAQDDVLVGVHAHAVTHHRCGVARRARR